MTHRSSSALLVTRLALGSRKSALLPAGRPRFGIITSVPPSPISHLTTVGGMRNKGSVAAPSGGGIGIGIGKGSISSSNSKPFTTAAEDAEDVVSSEDVEDVVSSAKGYYDDPNALNFHMQAWGGGGDVHLGRYDLLDKDELQLGVRDRVKRATALSTGILLGKAFPGDGPSPIGSTIADMGSAFGSTARRAAKEYGCNVECVEISKGFNAVNAELSAAEGLKAKIIIPDQRSFFDTKLPVASMDAVISQDAFVHAGKEHHKAIEEVARVLKPDGLFVFTDFMKTDNADTAKLAEVYRQLGIARLASPASFEEMGKACGLELVEFEERASNLGIHYQHIVDVCVSLRSVIKGVDDEWLNRMTTRYACFVSAAEFDVLTSGLFVFKKKSD